MKYYDLLAGWVVFISKPEFMKEVFSKPGKVNNEDIDISDMILMIFTYIFDHFY